MRITGWIGFITGISLPVWPHAAPVLRAPSFERPRCAHPLFGASTFEIEIAQQHERVGLRTRGQIEITGHLPRP